MRVGISGHQRLRDPGGWEWVRGRMRDCLASLPPPVVGLTSLAVGADTLFAELVLELGGALEVIVPFAGYEGGFESEGDRREYRRLFGAAARVEVLGGNATDEEGYYAAGKRIADLSDLLVLVWDGKPAAGLGGTGDIAEYARRTHKPFLHLNPETRTVTR
ncbi:MAG TPA: hypothetical protein VEQ42_00870 [Pyrinomonadaceae bacterium]|nr:hypothetical protein [Pyrinomonadaceae bacterium]